MDDVQTATVTRVDSTEAANQLIDMLRAKYGELMIHQSGGCCDGSTPMCFGKGEFLLGASDVQLGEVNGVGFSTFARVYTATKNGLY
jgi:uncharacterized protein